MFPRRSGNPTISQFAVPRGSALVIAVFITVVMLALVLSLSRLLLSSSEALIYEVQGNRAFFAAQSGLELSLTRVYPRSGSGSCSNVTFEFTDNGLRGCRAQVSCRAQLLPSGQITNTIFELQSIGICEADNFVTSRELVIEVKE